MSVEVNKTQKELEELLSEMFELFASGILKDENDLKMWLQDVESECKYSFTELKEFVEIYSQKEFGSDIDLQSRY